MRSFEPSVASWLAYYCDTIALAAEWWALLLVTGFRPERLLSTGGLGRLAAWATLAGAATLVTTRFVFQI